MFKGTEGLWDVINTPFWSPAVPVGYCGGIKNGL